MLRQREDEGALIEKRSLFRELVLALRDALRQHRARSGVLELAQMISDYPSPRHAAPTQLEVHRALLAALAENQPLVELDDRLPLTPRHTTHDRLRLGERLHAALAVEVDEVHALVVHARCRGRLGERLALLQSEEEHVRVRPGETAVGEHERNGRVFEKVVEGVEERKALLLWVTEEGGRDVGWVGEAGVHDVEIRLLNEVDGIERGERSTPILLQVGYNVHDEADVLKRLAGDRSLHMNARL